MPFTFPVSDGEEIHTAPCMYTPHLFSCVETFCDELSRYELAVCIYASAVIPYKAMHGTHL